MLRYLSMASMSLFALNLLPVYPLDGHWTLSYLIDLIGKSKLEREDDDMLRDVELQPLSNRLYGIHEHSTYGRSTVSKIRSILRQMRWVVCRWKDRIKSLSRNITLVFIAIVMLGMIRT